jgi:hypothetical protein
VCIIECVHRAGLRVAKHSPRVVKVETQQNGQRISCPTFSRVKAWVFMPFAVVIAVFSTWVVVAVWSGDARSEPVTAILITIPFLALSVFALYFALVALLNSVTIEISGGRLAVVQGPIPYARRRDIDAATIQQVYIIRRESRYSFSYKLYALIRGGSHRHLLTVEDAQLTLYLEEQIERALGMKDQVVRGEWRPEPYLWES